MIVEGPFARNRTNLAALSHATGCPVGAAGSATGTSQGAALPATARVPTLPEAQRVLSPRADPALDALMETWRQAAGSGSRAEV